MNAKAGARRCLRLACRYRWRGRYPLVEWLAPRLAESGRLEAVRVGRRAEMLCDVADDVQRQIAYGLYEPDEARIFASSLSEGDVVFDVGANVGYYTILAAERVGPTGLVHAFEAVASNADRLDANVAHNRFANVAVNRCAVSDGASETLRIRIPRRGTSRSTGWASIAIAPSALNEPTDVPATSLDAYVERERIERVSLVKMDIEGAELMALRGGSRLFSRPDAPRLICEVNGFLLDRIGSSPAELLACLGSYGYRLEAITARGLVPIRPDAGRSGLFNVFAWKG